MKGSESFLSGGFNDPYGRPGDSFRIRESWHVCSGLLCNIWYAFPLLYVVNDFCDYSLICSR